MQVDAPYVLPVQHMHQNNKFFKPLEFERRVSANDLLKQKQNEAKEKKKQEKIRKNMEKRQNLLKDKAIKLSYNQKEELFDCLIEYRKVLMPQMQNCRMQIEIALGTKNFNSLNYWKGELKNLQEVYARFQKQAVDIKMEVNDSNHNSNTIDLHSMTVDEALIALENKINGIVSFEYVDKKYFIKF